jgi:TRAP-type transport system small permease protein
MGVNTLSNLYNGFLKIIKWAIVALASILVVIVFVNVLGRYFLKIPLAWSDEAARFLFIWLTFLGAILANASNEHMQLDLLVGKMPKKVGQAVRILAYLIIMYILYLLLNGGFTVVIENLNWKSSALEVSYGLVYSIAPLSFVILMLQTAVRIISTAKALFGKNEVQKGVTHI